VILPGSKSVLDRATGKLVACDDTTCPNHVNGVNHAPFAAFGGWSGAINAAIDDKDKDATYAFFSYVNQPAQSNADVTVGSTGFNPYRVSQFENLDAWLAAGMSEESAKNYLGAIQASLNSPNMVLDLRIPQNQRYQQQVLDEKIAQLLAGEITKDEAMQQIYDGWKEINDELGMEDQQAAYQATLGVKK
jgi:multiple sugar transport system substrate-binding protein